MSEQQWTHQQRETGEEDEDARKVELCALLLSLRGHQPQCREHKRCADRAVDKEDRAPAETVWIEGHKPAADDEAHHAAQPERDAKDREGPAARLIGEQSVDGGKDLRHHQCGCEALGEMPKDQCTPRGRQAASERGRGKSDEADEEETPGPIHVTETPAGNDHRRVGDLIKRDHALDLGGAGMEIGTNRRDCDVHDEDVDHIHELRGNNHRQNKPTSRIDRVSRWVFHDVSSLLDGKNHRSLRPAEGGSPTRRERLRLHIPVASDPAPEIRD